MTLRPDMTLAELAGDDAAAREFAGLILDHGARTRMRRALGDRTPRQYDKADIIAEGIGAGVRNALRSLAR